MEQREIREFSFSDIRVHPNIITDILEKGEDVALTLRREGDKLTVYSQQMYNDGETGRITLEEVRDKTVSVLRHFTDNADKIMSELKPGWDAGLLEVMNRLAKRMDAVKNETDLLTIANIVHDLTIEIPHFPPDDEPPQHFRPENLMPGSDDCIESHKAALEEVFKPCFKRIEQAWYGDYPSGSVTGPAGPSEGSYRVKRGRCWLDSAAYCRSANRGFSSPGAATSASGWLSP
ncbi:hypothetical protein QUF80_19095 [Desulfococcaceae bacterium HSG8]|nr:hypothetical protein [Desulfococcaceae bacterium HSG8]